MISVDKINHYLLEIYDKSAGISAMASKAREEEGGGMSASDTMTLILCCVLCALYQHPTETQHVSWATCAVYVGC